MAEYDASKQYKWEESDEFVLNGNQFGLILNAFRNHLSKPESQEVMLMMKAETEMTTLLKQGVEADVIKEVPAGAQGEIPGPQPAPKKPTVRRKSKPKMAKT